MKFRKKPVVIDAIQFKDTNQFYTDLALFLQGSNRGTNIQRYKEGGVELLIDTLEGVMTASLDDWIIKGIQGELYPCKPDIFQLTYEEAE